MVNLNKLSATLLLIKYSLFPPPQSKAPAIHPENGTKALISPAQFAATLGGLTRLLRPDGTLELHFEGVFSMAGPFLLYRLKSCGFSGCKAVVTEEGILLTAIR